MLDRETLGKIRLSIDSYERELKRINERRNEWEKIYKGKIQLFHQVLINEIVPNNLEFKEPNEGENVEVIKIGYKNIGSGLRLRNGNDVGEPEKIGGQLIYRLSYKGLIRVLIRLPEIVDLDDENIKEIGLYEPNFIDEHFMMNNFIKFNQVLLSWETDY